MSKNKPLFSIITCTYNSEKFVSDNIQSVKEQTFKNYEHIFVDGNSTDNTVKLLRKYKKDNPKINIRILSKEPRGISNAMNRGIEAASGLYICILHSDDSFYDSGVLSDVENYLKLHPQLDWVYGKIRVVEEDGVKKVGYFPNRWFFQKGYKYLQKFINFIPHQAVFMKKNVFIKYGYFKENLKSAMDQELWLRINYKTNWKFFNRVISNYRIHSQATSSSKDYYEKNWKEYLGVQKKYLNNQFEKYLAAIINTIIKKINKMTR